MVERNECPCKFLPMSLSSFTAAEYGDIHSLSKIKDVATRRDDFGYTPLHYAAQFNHLAATSLLLNLGCLVDGGGYCGATPLHRASFSGATSAMKVILEWNSDTDQDYRNTTIPTASQLPERKCCDLLARDTSFGDESTALHKASAGGRYLAIYVLLEALKERDSRSQLQSIRFIEREEIRRREENNIRVSSSKKSLLQCGLEARDKYGRTSLDVAKHFYEIQDTERAAVARWDTIAVGLADWGKCIQLLENAAVEASLGGVNIEKDLKVKQDDAKNNNTSVVSQSKNSCYLPQLPVQMTKGVYECLDCVASGDNVCMTLSWQAAFQKALGESANLCIMAPTNHITTPTTTKPIIFQQGATGKSSISIGEKTDETSTTCATTSVEKVEMVQSIQSICPGCKKKCIAFYPFPGIGTLVCKSCVKRKKNTAMTSRVLN